MADDEDYDVQSQLNAAAAMVADSDGEDSDVGGDSGKKKKGSGKKKKSGCFQSMGTRIRTYERVSYLDSIHHANLIIGSS